MLTYLIYTCSNIPYLSILSYEHLCMFDMWHHISETLKDLSQMRFEIMIEL